MGARSSHVQANRVEERVREAQDVRRSAREYAHVQVAERLRTHECGRRALLKRIQGRYIAYIIDLHYFGGKTLI